MLEKSKKSLAMDQKNYFNQENHQYQPMRSVNNYTVIRQQKVQEILANLKNSRKFFRLKQSMYKSKIA